MRSVWCAASLEFAPSSLVGILVEAPVRCPSDGDATAAAAAAVSKLVSSLADRLGQNVERAGQGATYADHVIRPGADVIVERLRVFDAQLPGLPVVLPATMRLVKVPSSAADRHATVVVAEVLAIQFQKVEKQDAEIACPVDLSTLNLWMKLAGRVGRVEYS